MKQIIEKEIERIFSKNSIAKVKSIKKFDIGFNNDIYSINDKFIIKICKNRSKENDFKKEIIYYKLFRNEIPVPKILFVDISKKIINRCYFVYKKIEGENLYAKWHLLKGSQRKQIVKQICGILKIINNSNKKGQIDWHKKRYSKIRKLLTKITNKNILSSKLIQKTKDFVEKNHHILKEQKLGLVYWDLHFDNILIKNSKVVGFLDFEGIDIRSIDNVLDAIRRMQNYPKVYASKESEKFVKRKDYSSLLKWFEEFYPELFDFDKINNRLDWYSIEYDLSLLLRYPDNLELKKRLAKTVKWKII